MSTTSNVQLEAMNATNRKRKSPLFRRFGAACYCGLGPECARFRIMTPDQRIDCSIDMRREAQLDFKNGLDW